MDTEYEYIQECLNILRTRHVVIDPTMPADPTWIYVRQPNGKRFFEIHKLGHYCVTIVFDDGRRDDDCRSKNAFDLFDVCMDEYERQQQQKLNTTLNSKVYSK